MSRKAVVAAFLGVCAIQLAVQGWVIHRWENVMRNGKAFKFRTAPVDPYDAFRGRYVALNFEATRVPLHAKPIEDDSSVWKTMCAIIEEGPDGFARFASLQEAPPASGAYVTVRVQYVQRNPWFEAKDITDPEKLAREVLLSDRPLCVFLRKNLSEKDRAALKAYLKAPVLPAPDEVAGALSGMIRSLQHESLPADVDPSADSRYAPYGHRLAFVLKEFPGCLTPPPPAEAIVDLPFDRYYMLETKAPAAERAYWDNSRRRQQHTYALVRVLDGQALIENVFIDDKPIGKFVEESPEKK